LDCIVNKEAQANSHITLATALLHTFGLSYFRPLSDIGQQVFSTGYDHGQLSSNAPLQVTPIVCSMYCRYFMKVACLPSVVIINWVMYSSKKSNIKCFCVCLAATFHRCQDPSLHCLNRRITCMVSVLSANVLRLGLEDRGFIRNLDFLTLPPES